MECEVLNDAEAIPGYARVGWVVGYRVDEKVFIPVCGPFENQKKAEQAADFLNRAVELEVAAEKMDRGFREILGRNRWAKT